MLSNFVDQAGAPDFVVATGTHQDITCVKAADPNHAWCIDQIIYSYSGSGSSGRLTVVIGSKTYLDVDVPANWSIQFLYPTGLFDAAMKKNVACTVTLSDGGAAVVGKLSVRFR